VPTTAEGVVPELTDDESSIVRTSMIRFALLSLAALVVLGTGIQLASGHVARSEAVRDSRMRSQGVTTGLVAPLVGGALRSGDQTARANLARAMETRIRDGSFAHVIVWDADGTVMWSDETALIGNRYHLTRGLKSALGSRRVLSSMPGDDDRDGVQITGETKLVSVYVTARGVDGSPFLFEGLVSPDRIATERAQILREFLPLGLGGLLIFQLAMLPLAYSLARRVDRARRRRSEVLQRSLLSWHQERRRLAQELHDGVVQDLSAASYALPSVVKMLPPDPSADTARATGQRIGTLLRQDLQAMRSLVSDLLPADLEGVGLTPALEALAERQGGKGALVHLEVAPDLHVGPEVAGLVYRVVREGLRNVERHAHASNVWVRVDRSEDLVDIVLTDDGRGLGNQVDQNVNEHFGLRLLHGLAGDVGGSLALSDRPEGGAVMEVRLPAVLPV
jgi:signal transduction histidine kinase